MKSLANLVESNCESVETYFVNEGLYVLLRRFLRWLFDDAKDNMKRNGGQYKISETTKKAASKDKQKKEQKPKKTEPKKTEEPVEKEPAEQTKTDEPKKVEDPVIDDSTKEPEEKPEELKPSETKKSPKIIVNEMDDAKFFQFTKLTNSNKDENGPFHKAYRYVRDNDDKQLLIMSIIEENSKDEKDTIGFAFATYNDNKIDKDTTKIIYIKELQEMLDKNDMDKDFINLVEKSVNDFVNKK